MKQMFQYTRRQLAALWAVCMSVVTGALFIIPQAAGAVELGEAFKPSEVADDLLEKLGPVGVAVIAIFVAVFLFTVGLHFFRRHSKSVAK